MSELLAPNGKPSNLTPEQYKLVRTPAFKKWFGDWENEPENSSKVVDEETKEPLVVYHGTENKFNIFKISNFGQLGKGIYFSNYYNEAKGYSELNNSKKAKVIGVFLNIKNPKYPTNYELKNSELFMGESNEVYERLINLKYDGIIFKFDKITSRGDKYISLPTGQLEINAFKPNQIKLADGTNTDFDSGNPDIRFNDGGSVLLAPNGKPSNLTAEQYKLVRTPAFKEWFGDWEKDPENSSKVIDSNGEPLIVFHGSPTGKRFNSFKSKWDLFYFASEKDVAKNQYSSSSSDGVFQKDNRVFDVFLNIRNPYIIDAENREYCDINHNFDNENYEILEDLAYSVKNYQIEDSEIYDGLIAKRVDEEQMFGGYGKNAITDVYVSFSPNQIKIADGTNTTFDNNNVDIRFNVGGQVYSKEYINKSIEKVLKTYKYLDEEEYSEIENNLYNFSNQDFPIGLYNLPKQIKLYRIIYLKSEKDFNKDNLGVHFIADTRLINDDFLWSIGITKKEYKKLYLVTINVDSEYIDIDWTLSYKARYPNEFEFTLKDNPKYEMEGIVKYNPNIRFDDGGEVYIDDLSEKSKKIIESNYNGSFGFFDFDWNKESERENFTEWVKEFREKQFSKNLDKVIGYVKSDIELKNNRTLSDLKLKAFEELIIPTLGNEVLSPKLSIYEEMVLRFNHTIEDLEKGFKEAKNIIDEDGSINQSKITQYNIFEEDSINISNFERFVEKNPEYKGVFNDWMKLVNQNVDLSLKNTYAFRYPSVDDLEYLYSELVELKNKKLKDKFNTGGEVGTGLFSQIWDWFGIKF